MNYGNIGSKVTEYIRDLSDQKSNVAAVASTLAFFLILGFGFALRYEAYTKSEVPEYPHGDAAKYFLYAYNLKNFGIYGNPAMQLHPANIDKAFAREIVTPDAFINPGYPLFLSLFLGGEYKKEQLDAARFVQVLISALTILIAYAAFEPLGRIYSLGVAALLAINPHLINLNLFLLTEALFCFLLTLAVWFMSRARMNDKPLLFLFIGLMLAAATLTRPWIQGYLFVFMGYMAVSKLRIRYSNILLVFVGAAILTTPWIARNMLILGEPGDPSMSVMSIHHGMYPDMMYEGNSESLGYAYRYDPMSPELGKSLDVTLRELKRRASEKPADYLRWYLIGKSQSVLSWKMIAAADAVFVYQVEGSPYFELPRFYLSSYFMEKIHGALMLLALVGAVIVWLPGKIQRRMDGDIFFLRALSLLVFYFLVAHSVFAPYPRYSIPMRPVLYAMALYPIVFLVQFSGLRSRLGKFLADVRRGQL